MGEMSGTINVYNIENDPQSMQAYEELAAMIRKHYAFWSFSIATGKFVFSVKGVEGEEFDRLVRLAEITIKGKSSG
jgi:hypothetical protein